MDGVLILHGFAGSRREVEPLGAFLEERGMAVEMPCLPGHEGSRKALAASTRAQWIRSAEESLKRLAQACDKVSVVGFSMGGLLAVQLAQRYSFKRLVTINTPFYYWPLRNICRNLKRHFVQSIRKYWMECTNKPLSSLWQFQRLLSETKPLFGSICCSCLVVQTEDDDTVHPKSALRIYDRLGGEKKLFTQPNGGHVVLESEERMKVVDAVSSFLLDSTATLSDAASSRDFKAELPPG